MAIAKKIFDDRKMLKSIKIMAIKAFRRLRQWLIGTTDLTLTASNFCINDRIRTQEKAKKSIS